MMTREDLDEEIEELQNLLSLAVETFGYNHKHMTTFFGKKLSNQLIRVLADVAVLAPALLIIIFLK